MPLSGRRVGLSRGRLRCCPGAGLCPLPLALAVAAGATPADRCCPVSLALCAGAYWRTLEARGLVRRLTGPFALVAAPACTNRWFSTPAPGTTRPDHSPYFDVGRSLRGETTRCQLGPRELRARPLPYQYSSVWSVPMSWPRSRTKPWIPAHSMTVASMPGLPHRKMSKLSGVSARPVSCSIALEAMRFWR